MARSEEIVKENKVSRTFRLEKALWKQIAASKKRFLYPSHSAFIEEALIQFLDEKEKQEKKR